MIPWLLIACAVPDAPPASSPGAMSLTGGPTLALSVVVNPDGSQTATVTDAVPGEAVALMASTGGTGPGPCPAVLAGSCLDVVSPMRRLNLTANGSGTATRTIQAPPGAPLVAWQALAPRTGVDAAFSDVIEVGNVPRVLAADCQPQANVLRFDCHVTLDRIAPALVVVRDAAGTEVGRFASDAALDHVIPVYGLRAQQTYTTVTRAGDEATGLAGTITTGALPSAVDLVLDVVDTTERTVGPVLFNMGCGPTDHLVVADPEGEVIWYQDIATLDPLATVSRGLTPTDRGTFLVLVDRGGVAELEPGGAVRFHVSQADGDFVNPVHHDVLLWNDRVAAIHSEALPYPDGKTYVIDGVEWFDPDTATSIATFSAADINDPQGTSSKVTGYWSALFPGAIDWAHTNAMAMNPDGTAILSLKAMDTLQKVVLDPDRADFGTLLWTLTGKATSPLVSDLTRISSTNVAPLTFGDQHHISVLPDGDLLFFDNQPGPQQLSRVLRVRVDEAAGTADLQEQWAVGRSCPAQGSAVLLPNGNVLADCADDNTMLEIEGGTQAVVWSMTASCANGAAPPRPLYRAYPLDW